MNKVTNLFIWFKNLFKYVFKKEEQTQTNEVLTKHRIELTAILDFIYRIDQMLLSATLLWTNASISITEAIPKEVGECITNIKKSQAIENLIAANETLGHLLELINKMDSSSKEGLCTAIENLIKEISLSIAEIETYPDNDLDLVQVKELYYQTTIEFEKVFKMKIASSYLK